MARNEATAESDIDIAIILNGSFSGDTRDAFLEFAANLDLKYERVFSIIDIDRSNMEKSYLYLESLKNAALDRKEE